MLEVTLPKSLRSVLALLLVTSAAAAHGQLLSGTQSVNLTAILPETLTIAATSNNVTFALAGGTVAIGSVPVVIVTTWTLQPGRANLVLDGYFASASAALTDAATTPNLIPAAAVLGKVTTGSPTSYTAFTQTAALGPAGAGLTLLSIPLTTANRAGVRTDNLSLEINLGALPQVPAGTYTGIITLQAQAL